MRQWGFYAGDQWRARRPAHVDLRRPRRHSDVPGQADGEPAAVLSTYGFATDVVPKRRAVVAARRVQLRPLGQRTPSRSGAASACSRAARRTSGCRTSTGNTGIEFTRVTVGRASTRNNRVPFVPDPNTPPTNVGTAATNEIDMIDPDYKYPSLVRGSTSPTTASSGSSDSIGTAEFLYSHERQRHQVRRTSTCSRSARVRMAGRFSAVTSTADLSDAILLTNTDQGEQWSIVFKVERPFSNGFFMSGSYLYGESTSILDGTSSQAASNWGNVFIGGEPEQSAAGPVELRSGSPHHDLRRLRHSGRRRLHGHRVGVLQRPVRPSVVG